MTMHPLRKAKPGARCTLKVTGTVSAMNSDVHTTLRPWTLRVRHSDCGSQNLKPLGLKAKPHPGDPSESITSELRHLELSYELARV